MKKIAVVISALMMLLMTEAAALADVAEPNIVEVAKDSPVVPIILMIAVIAIVFAVIRSRKKK